MNVMNKAESIGAEFKLSKCAFAGEGAEYWGFWCDGDGRKPTEAKLEQMNLGQLREARRVVMRHLETLTRLGLDKDSDGFHTRQYSRWGSQAGKIVAFERRLRGDGLSGSGGWWF